MIIRTFFTIAAFLLLVVIFNETPLLNLKELASNIRGKTKTEKVQITQSNELQKRIIELGAVQSKASRSKKEERKCIEEQLDASGIRTWLSV